MNEGKGLKRHTPALILCFLGQGVRDGVEVVTVVLGRRLALYQTLYSFAL